LGGRRDSLIKKGLIFSPDHGEVNFTVPHFSPFMRRRYRYSLAVGERQFSLVRSSFGSAISNMIVSPNFPNGVVGSIGSAAGEHAARIQDLARHPARVGGATHKAMSVSDSAYILAR